MAKPKPAVAPEETSAPKAAANVVPPPAPPTHCPYRQADRLQQALTPDKMRVAFFLGAGCPMAIRVPEGPATRPLIPNIEGLTKLVCDELEKSDGHHACSTAVIKRLCDNGSSSPTIEEIFSHIRALQDIIGTGMIDGLEKQGLADLDQEICNLVTATVRQRLPTHDTPYHKLATWIGGIRRAFPVEVFTSNYDLLMEQALEERRVPYFDGFVGSDRTFFDITSMEQDALPTRWSRLWKVHGSINTTALTCVFVASGQAG